LSSYDYILTSNGGLYHHGVKGQKWGVRRYQNKDGSLTAAGKKRAQNTRSEGRLISVDDGFVLKKGTRVQRVSTDQEERIGAYTYVSFSKHDNEFYNKYFTENLDFADPTNTIYRNSLVTTADLKIPSRDTNKRIFTEVYKELTNDLVEAMADSRRISDISYDPRNYQFKAHSEKYNGDYRRAFADAVEYYRGRYANMTVKQLQDDAYYDFMHMIGNCGNRIAPIRQAYFDKLKSEGYNAILDDNDSKGGLGARGYADDDIPTYPLMILDASEVLKRTGSTVLKK
jgi:hypothetical protein